MKPDKIINIHGHLRYSDDIPARVRIWEAWNIVKFCCLCLPDKQPHSWALTNGDFLKVQKDYKGLMVGFAGVNIGVDGIDKPADIRRLKDQGFTGLKFIGAAHAYNDDVYFPIYDAAQELAMPILFHTGFLGQDVANDRARRIDSELMSPYKLDRLARSFPRLNIIGAHLGHPQQPVALYLMEFFPNLFFDMTGGGGSTAHVRMMLSALLPHPGLETDMTDPQQNRALKWFENIVFGTDNPEPSVWVPASEMILDRLQIPQRLRDKFYYGTAAKILGLE